MSLDVDLSWIHGLSQRRQFKEESLDRFDLLMFLRSLLWATLPVQIWAGVVFDDPIGAIARFLWYGIYFLLRTFLGYGPIASQKDQWLLGCVFVSLFLATIQWGFDLQDVVLLDRIQHGVALIQTVILLLMGDKKGPPPRKKDDRDDKKAFSGLVPQV